MLTLVLVAFIATLASTTSAQAAGEQYNSNQLTYTCQVAGVPDRATIGVLFDVVAPRASRLASRSGLAARSRYVCLRMSALPQNT